MTSSILGQMGRWADKYGPNLSRSTAWTPFRDKHGHVEFTDLISGPLIIEFATAVDVCYFDLLQCCTIDMKSNMAAVNNIIINTSNGVFSS